MKIETLQLIYPYYDNPHMLEYQLEFWHRNPWQFKERFKVILVDDGSEKHPAEEVLKKYGQTSFELDLYRIKVNIPWNQNGAHNLGMHVAEGGWCVCTDIDHVLVSSQLNVIFELDVDEGTYYTFGRRQSRALTTVFKRHPNSWLLTRDVFWASGGYDEDFSGFYGSDSVFRRCLDAVAKRVELEEPYLVVYDESDVDDANTTEFGRKNSEYHSPNFPHLQKKRRHYSKPVDPLRFPWERVL